MATLDEKVKAAFGSMILDNMVKESQIESLIEENNKLKAELEDIKKPKLVEKEGE